jgi:hypothetical protein
MATFIYTETEGGLGSVTLEAESGEELTPAQASAWAALQSQRELDYISTVLSDLVNATQR